MPSTTPNLGLNKGAHGDWLNVWEGPMNDNMDTIDRLVDAVVGHKHTGVAGDAPKIDHASLTNIGTLTHAQLEVAGEKVKVTAADILAGYLQGKIAAGANISIAVLNPGFNEQLEITAIGGGGSPWTDADEYGDKHTTPTSAPVAYTDNFNWPLGFYLKNADYMVETDPGISTFDFLSTGYSARIYAAPSQGDPAAGTWTSAVACHFPHSPAQRTTLSITDFDASEFTNLGDSVCFTLSVYSTHRVGPNLPQKYGVMLEVHATCVGVGPAVYQVSHRVVVVPDGVTRVEFPACVHTNINDIKGCWELSLDQNGHVYTYWRKQLVYSSQTSPVSTPGPVAAYFAALSASLQADGDPRFGSMGFGMKYTLSPSSKLDLEIRWLSVTAADDLYDEAGSCTGVPLVGPALPVFPKEFLTMPPGDGVAGIPGTACCPGALVGDVLEYSGTTPIVWIEACGMGEGGIDGYKTNISEVTTPCAPIVIPVSPADTRLHIVAGTWEEGQEGIAILTGIGPLPPSVRVVPPAGITILNTTWLDYYKLLIEYAIDDGMGGTTPALTIEDRYNLVNSVVYTAPAIDETAVVIAGAVFALKYNSEPRPLGPQEGDVSTYTLSGSGFSPADVVTCSDITVVVTTTYVNPGRITGDITVPSLTAGPFTLFVNGVASVATTVTPEAPYLYYVTATANVPGASVISIMGSHFQVGVTGLVTAGGFVIGIGGFVRISATRIDITGTVIGGPPSVWIRVTNPNGTFVNVPCLEIGALAPPPVVALPAPMAGVKNQTIQINGVPFFESTYVIPQAGLTIPVGCPYGTPANWRIDSWALNQINVSVDADCADAGNAISFWSMNPGALPNTLSPVFTVGTPVVPAGLVLTPASATRGQTVIGMTVTGVGITQFSTIAVPSSLSVANVVPVAGTITFDLTIPASAAEYAVYPITVVNPCGNTSFTNFTVAEDDPVLSAYTCEFLFNNRNAQEITFTGIALHAGGVLIATAGAAVTGFVWVSDTQVNATVNFLGLALATFQWTNPAGGIDTINVPVAAEPAPIIYHTSVNSPDEGATNQDILLYGDFLDPMGTGMSIALTNAALLSVVTWTNSYVHLKADITGVAGNNITGAITGSILYPAFYIETILAPSAAPPSVSSVSFVPAPLVEAGGGAITIEGTGLLQAIFVEIRSSFPNKSDLLYIPWGVAFPATFVFTSHSDIKIEGTITLGADLAPLPLDIDLLDALSVLLLTVPSAITPDPFAGPPSAAPVIQNPAVFNTILEVSAVPQVIVVQMVDPIQVGDLWSGDNVGVAQAQLGPNTWQLNFTITAPGPYCFYCNRLPGPPSVTHGRGTTGVSV